MSYNKAFLKLTFFDKEQVVELASGVKVASLGLGEDELVLVQLAEYHKSPVNYLRKKSFYGTIRGS